MDALEKAYQLKDEQRTGWIEKRIDPAESVAAHSWGTAFLCLVFGGDEGIDVDRAVQMAIVHDLAEAETGDIRIGPDDQETDREEKHRREQEAMQQLAEGKLAGVKPLWDEYEDRDSHEARFVKDMDMVDMCLQAVKYVQDGKAETTDMDEFFDTARSHVTTDTGKRLLDRVEERYRSIQR